MNRFYSGAVTVVGTILSLFLPWETEGLDHIPPGAVLVCGNHNSNWDPVLVALAFTKRHPLHFMAKVELTRIPVLGTIIKWLGAFGVDRGHSDLGAIRQAIQYLKNGETVMMFPQGGREKDNHKEAKTGAALLALRTGVPVLPVYITKKKRIFRKNKVIIGHPYYPQKTGKWSTAEEYRLVAGDLMNRIIALGNGHE